MKPFLARIKWGVNPIIVKELRSRMRGPRAFITLTVILLLMGALMYGFYQIILATTRYSSILSPQIGQAMFASLVFLELFMICIITPAVTAGAISSEKEKQTYEMLMSTPLSPTRILLGKFISAMTYVFLLLFAAVPLASVVFTFGGVAPLQMLRALLMLLLIAFTLGVLGVFMSALFGRTGWATVASFISVVVLSVGPIFVAVLVGLILQKEPPRWILAPSPISALSSAIAIVSSNGQDIFGSLFGVLSGVWSTGVAPISQTDIPRPLYHYNIAFFLGFSLLLYLFATRLVQPTRRFHLKRKEWLLGIASIVLFCGVVAGAFLFTARHYEWAVQSPSGNLAIGPNPISGPAPAPAVGIQANQVVQLQTAYPAPTLKQNAIQTLPPYIPPTSDILFVADSETLGHVYALALRQFLNVDKPLGDKMADITSFSAIMETNDPPNLPNLKSMPPSTLDEKTTTTISNNLQDLYIHLNWVKYRDDVALDSKTSAVLQGKTAILNLGNIHTYTDDSGTLSIPINLYISPKQSFTYLVALKREINDWSIIRSDPIQGSTP